MMELLESVRNRCPDVDPARVERHFHSLPVTYFERFAPTDIVRHVRLIAGLSDERPVAVELRPIAAQTLEAVVAGFDHPGALSCIAAALAADGFSLEDVQVSTYLDPVSGADVGPRCFVVVVRVGGQTGGSGTADLARRLQDRLTVSFAHLAQGELVEAQVAALNARSDAAEPRRATPVRATPAPPRKGARHEGRLLAGDFRLERKLASGGMSEVYLATQLSLKRTVAVKVFRHEGPANDEYLVRFNRESITLAQFSCPAIVQVLAAGDVADGPDESLNWMAMEYLAGGDLGGWIERHGAPPLEHGVRWLRQALEGLHYAHRRGVLHRDLKPHNLLLNDEGDVKVSDFGLLKQVQSAALLTPRSAILGTPYYMAPEQALGEPVDERSDLFSLGATFFHVFTGQLAFDKDTATAVLVQIAQEDAPRLTDVAPEAPVALAVIVGRMMARRREERYQEAGVVLEDLASYERRGLLTGSAVAPTLATPAAHAGAETQVHSPHSETIPMSEKPRAPLDPMRRDFLRAVGALGVGADAIPMRPFGRADVKVSALAMGGHHLGDLKTVDEAVHLVQEAVDSGITFFDNCWEYHNGKSEDWLGRGLKGRRDKVFLMTKVCTHGRGKGLAMKMLEESLRRLQTDHLDLWQIHGVSFDNDPELAYRKGGVTEALDEAKKQGKTRFVGFTGHKDPSIHLKMLELGYPFDAVQMPLNPFDGEFHSFEKQVLPELNKRGIAALGMKSMGGKGESIQKKLVTAEELLRYAMSLPVTTTISGIDARDVLHQNLRVARGFQPMTPEEMEALRKRCAPTAADGRFEMYKVSLRFDNPQARLPHDFPLDPTIKEVKDMFESVEAK